MCIRDRFVSVKSIPRASVVVIVLPPVYADCKVIETAEHLTTLSVASIQRAFPVAVVKIKEQQFTELLSRSNTTDADRQAAYSLVNSIGPDIERALDIVQKKCGCTLVVKNAVLAGSANDYTDVLKEQLGMTKGGN